MSHPHADLIDRFYTAFAAHDAAGMVACYHPQITFSDPVFGTLQDDAARAMWQMLVGRSGDLRVVARNIRADDDVGSAAWDAWYTFTQTGRAVHNRVTASFRFADGLIREHHDHFSLWRWEAQALGMSGMLLGWSPPVRTTVRKRAQGQLAQFRARQTTGG